MSSCIGIVQVWWHPYLHDMKKFIPFIFLYNILSVIFGYPLMYLELALGIVTKKSVINCWDLSPVARGVGFAMLACCALTAFVSGAVSAWCLALLVHSAHAFLPWLHCAATAQPACAARHRPLPEGSETPAQSFFFNFILNLKRDGLKGGLGSVVPELAVYYVISWLLIYFIAFKRIYSYSKLVLFKDVLTYFVLLVCVLGATRLSGAAAMFNECDWNVLLEGTQIWRDALEYSLVQMSISQGVLVMLGSYCPKAPHTLATTALLTFLVAKTSCMGSALLLGAAHGALRTDYDNDTNIWSGSSSSIILWADYVARIPGSQFWSALVFFTLFVLSVSTTALLLQTIMSTFTGHSIRKISWAFLVAICVLFCFIGVMTICTQGGLYILNFLISWPVSKARAPIAAVVAFVITYTYGQTTFCDEIYFAVGEYPCMFMRISWALTPLLFFVVLTGVGSLSTFEATAGLVSLGLCLVAIPIFIIFYFVFRCRVRKGANEQREHRGVQRRPWTSAIPEEPQMRCRPLRW
ncbi:Sodium-dependent serotonin transporter [Papilio xuthus]|uniref:Sodium-dependent nutrient amino acid transporter 1 n=1 Tax=Papilio xuthus TaxID=66420 RepID=A0A194PWV1_PAPXU|nr:Sodium-dependent serotonin transporter [Papilio xuthus]